MDKNERPISIIRHFSTRNYIELPRQTCQDTKIGWRGLGMLVYMLSLPADWKFYLRELSARRGGHGNGTSATRAALQELQELGYLKIERQRAAGRIVGTVWHLSDLPIFQGNQDSAPGCDFQNMENQASENHSLHSRHVDKVNKAAAAKDSAAAASGADNSTTVIPPFLEAARSRAKQPWPTAVLG